LVVPVALPQVYRVLLHLDQQVMVVILHLMMVEQVKLDLMVVDVGQVLAVLVLLVVLAAVVVDFRPSGQLLADPEILHQDPHLKVIMVELDVQIVHFQVLEDMLLEVVVVLEILEEMQVPVLEDLVVLDTQFPNFLLRLFNQKFLHQYGQLLVLRLAQQVFMLAEVVAEDMEVFPLQQQEDLAVEEPEEFKMVQVLRQVVTE
jgi:hypothetical protein